MAKVNFKKTAQEQTTLSDIMVGRDKILTEDIIDEFNGIITVADMDLTSIGTEKVWAYQFKEAPDRFAFAGLALSNIFNAWLAAYEGDITAMREDYLKSPVKFKLEETKTKDKKQFTKVSVID